MTDRTPQPSEQPLHSPLGGIALNAIRWRSGEPDIGYAILRDDVRWLLRYIAEAEAAAPDPVASPRKWDYNAPHPFESKDLGNPTYDFCICERRRTDAMHLPDPVASPAGTRLILTDDVFLEEWRIRTDDGYRITAEWGDPDEHGWYEPTFTVDYSDRIAGAVASPAPLDVLRLARAIEQHRTGRWYDPTLKSDFEEAEGIAAEYARLEGQPVAEEPTDAP